ncbi:DNA-directed RNA polymerase subunit beta' [Candidatus Uhrbacteria bacterium]|nr:DNA-directed RNA polymerase subunit beta' [Candidatus Uhrbacteria bacterium]
MHGEERKDSIQAFDFKGIRLKVASAQDMLRWSYGEVTRPETINYRTQRPEKDGLFSERIFGPTKDWECYCGKYKKIRYKGIICDKCGVEVTRSIVRRERMGHITLATPVSHIWFLRGVPSKIGLALDMSVQNLERVIYFANFIITDVNEEMKTQTVGHVREEYKTAKKNFENECNGKVNALRSQQAAAAKTESASLEKQITSLLAQRDKELVALEENLRMVEDDIKSIKPMVILSESRYRDFSLSYGHLFEAAIGAEAIRKLLERIDVKALEESLRADIERAQGLKREKLVRRAKLIKSFMNNGVRLESMIMTVVPIIPPDLRPMVALDGGRFATSDLNDLYRRVINRNNRLKQLIELKAPEVICRNEKRMLQEAVDAFIDNSARHGKTVMASTGQKRTLKSLADMLKGKRGRFRQNLLGKRIDYSGRSVIVVGPSLKLHQCGLPKSMALDLFKPFVMSRLIAQGEVYNVRSASRYIETGRDEVWDILEDIVKDAFVLLNRAPTLHRLGIQAFKPILIEGKAIQVHPLVCPAFNADFDGDQMAVHVPLSQEARKEASEIMLSSHNLLKPASGHPIAVPQQDIVWGAFYMTYTLDAEGPKTQEKMKKFCHENEAVSGYLLKFIDLQERILVRFGETTMQRMNEADRDQPRVETTVGRILFNKILPTELPFYNTRIDKKMMGEIVLTALERCGIENTAKMLDNIKEVCAKYLTDSGLSFGMDDIPVLPEKGALIKDAENRIDEVQNQYDNGLLTFQERKSKVIAVWTETREKVSRLSKTSLPNEGSVYSIIESGARGTWAQLNQIIGMKGLVTNPLGETIELAVKGSFKEGLGVLEYFISTHGARKGLVDTALRTSNAGYLTRRLVDVAQDVVVNESDCLDREGMVITKQECDAIDVDFYDRLFGRTCSQEIADTQGDVLVKRNEIFTKEVVKRIREAGVENVRIRSLLSCRAVRGVCQKCYGLDLAYSTIVKPGTAVGIIAAQSLGEPGTQLTMRTFHTGGVAGADITQGLPRVEELFEVRTPKNKATLTDVGGRVSITQKTRSTIGADGKEITHTESGQKIISIQYQEDHTEQYRFSPRKRATAPVADEEAVKKPKKAKIRTVHVSDGQQVNEGDLLFTVGETETHARSGGTVKMERDGLAILGKGEGVQEYIIPSSAYVIVKDKELVAPGDPLTEGDIDLQMYFKHKGKLETQKYIINEIHRIYTSQGQKLNDKHIEVIIRQMFSRMMVVDAGDTDLLAGEVIEHSELIEENRDAKKEGEREAKGDELLMGITKASLSTRSWLSAASFQETARILINAAVTGKADYLEGLKENVIIGRLIPVGTGYEKRRKGE